MLSKINEIISTVNFIACNIRNIQVYVGTANEVDTATITGRLKLLEEANGSGLLDAEGKIKCKYIRQSCTDSSGADTWHGEEWVGTEWPAENNTEQTATKEW